jgi:4-alpha-glucanotransferase
MLHFHINYQTHYGQTIALRFADGTELPLTIQPDMQQWSGSLDTKKTDLEYKYVLLDANHGTDTEEWGKMRRLSLPKGEKNVVVRDAWRSAARDENPLYKAAFYNAVMKAGNFENSNAAYKKTTAKANIRLQIYAPRVDTAHQICVLLDENGSGDLAQHRMVLLQNAAHPLWSADFALDATTAVAYKYGLWDAAAKKIVLVETGEVRWIAADAFANKNFHVVTDEAFRYPENWKGAGVAIPVFALRTARGFGVGEFKDIETLADWSAQVGMRMIQILPINDTTATHTWVDSYPYSGVSVYALHPMFLNIEAIGVFPTQEAKAEYLALRETLNTSETVDYEGVNNAKRRFTRLMYGVYGAQHFKTTAYKNFFETNKNWLLPYAVFCYLRDEYGTPDFSNWGEYAVYSEEKVAELLKPRSATLKEIQLHCFAQYHLHLQLKAAADYCRSKNILLKGDIPIGIYRYSAEAWTTPRYFNMDGQAGAPPDSYSATGQNWGFPTYDWHEMGKDGFQWWRSRLQHLATYFDAYRIDHILGFFRIWEIPYDHTYGMMGRFNPAWGINKNEFEARGVAINWQRFCTPYVREYMFHSYFGHEAEYMRYTYFDENRAVFTFKPFVDTQRKVEHVFEVNDDMHAEERAWKTLMSRLMKEMHAEVLLFEAPFANKEAFHPRIELQKTNSYNDLSAHEKQVFDELYYDYFYQKQEPFWRSQADIRLPAINEATDMLICGEDLGMVPQSVPDVMYNLQMLSLHIQRMPKGYGSEFGHPANYDYWSVCSPSCHDMSTVRGWWEEDRDRAQRFYNEILGHYGSAPFFCENWLVEEIVNQHLYSPSMWAVFPIQDLVGMDNDLRRENPTHEQINDPSNGKHYWRYRFHINIEMLCDAKNFNGKLYSMVAKTGRMKCY